jgi:hypothetical protein
MDGLPPLAIGADVLEVAAGVPAKLVVVAVDEVEEAGNASVVSVELDELTLGSSALSDAVIGSEVNVEAVERGLGHEVGFFSCSMENVLASASHWSTRDAPHPVPLARSDSACSAAETTAADAGDVGS